MKRRGFTLVELLAAIVILGIVLAILIPSVSGVMTSSKYSAYTLDKKIVLKAAKRYAIENDNVYPLNIGDTTEITLSTLQTNKYIDTIKDPSDKSKICNGYVLLTKTSDTNYQYNSFLNCGNGAGTKVGDNLVAYYPFDEFEEPTQNIFPRSSQALAFVSAYNGSSYGFGSGTNLQQTINSSLNFDERSVVTKVSRISDGISQNDYVSINLSSPLNSTMVVSFWYYGTYGTIIRPYNNDGSANLYYLDSSGNWVGGSTAISIPVPVNTWYQVTIKIVNKGVTAGTGLSWMILHYNQTTTTLNTNQYWAFTKFQYEEKDHATPFTDTSRTSTVYDYSGNGSSTALQLAATPQWISNAKVGGGAYNFNGTSGVIDLPANLSTVLNNSSFTISAWVKSSGLVNGSSASGIISLGYGLILRVNSTSQLECLIDDGVSGTFVSTTGANLFDNLFHHVALTYDRTNVRLYIDGIEKQKQAVAWNNRFNNAGVIGTDVNDSANRRFRGIIDDIIIYSRALSGDEINLIYQSGK